MPNMTLKAETRDTFTRSAIRRLRKELKVPGVVYGRKVEPLPVALNLKEVVQALKHPNAVIELQVAGAVPRRVVVRDVQRDAIDRSVVSVDLHQVELNEPVRAHVRLVPLPDPQGKQILYQMFLHEIQIEGLPDRLPSAIEVDLAPVKDGHSILVGDLPIPDGLQVLTKSDEVVVAPFHAQYESEPEAAAGA